MYMCFFINYMSYDYHDDMYIHVTTYIIEDKNAKINMLDIYAK